MTPSYDALRAQGIDIDAVILDLMESMNEIYFSTIETKYYKITIPADSADTHFLVDVSDKCILQVCNGLRNRLSSPLLSLTDDGHNVYITTTSIASTLEPDELEDVDYAWLGNYLVVIGNEDGDDIVIKVKESLRTLTSVYQSLFREVVQLYYYMNNIDVNALFICLKRISFLKNDILAEFNKVKPLSPKKGINITPCPL